MSKSKNIGLELTESDLFFEDWYRSINGNNDGEVRELSNMQIIDNELGKIRESLVITNE